MPALHFASDLHAELSDSWRTLENHLSGGEDLVLAGDVGNVEAGSWEAVLRHFSPLVRQLYVVLGNHDLWTSRATPADAIVEQARSISLSMSNVTLLHREVAVTPEGVHIAGLPLWTDPTRVPQAAYSIRSSIADFDRIYHAKNKRLDLATATAWSGQDREWLKSLVAAPPSPLVVVSHFAPLESCNPLQYSDSDVLPYFCNALPSSLLAPVSVWIYGHVHGGQQAQVVGGSTRVVRHCVGYVKEEGHLTSIGTIEIPSG